MYTEMMDGSSSGIVLASSVRERFLGFVAPLVRDLDFWMDRRLVRTLVGAVEAILVFRNRAQGLLLSELGAYLLSPERAPAGTKRLSNLLRSEKWTHKRIGRFLWERACDRLREMERAGEEALVLWDASVLEKPESIESEGLCAVRSTKAARLKRVKPGFYNPPGDPPGGRPVFVPGMHWLALMIAGLSSRSGPAQVAVMQWWTKRGEHTTDARTVQTQVLMWCVKQWRQRAIHIFDRGYAGHPWVSLLLYYRTRFVLRWPNRYKLVGLTPEGRIEPREDPDEEREGRAAWKLATGKKAWDQKLLRDTHTQQKRSIAILALPVRHPSLTTPLWLVVARSGHGREPWYLLTSEKVETKEDAWRIYFAYHRRWQVEMAFRFNKCELAMESPRLWRWDNRLKLLSLVTLAYSFLLLLLRPELHAIVEQLFDRFCHRTGKRGREASTPLYRLRAALSRLWLAFPSHTQTTILASAMNSG